ncbi:MAG: GNAT family N-acetyltransferase [Phycisphaerae bacterium]
MVFSGQLSVRTEVTPNDCEAVRELVASTGFFHPPEVDVAVELVEERLAKGPASGYEFVFLESGGRLIGYSCFGPIPCTVDSYDLYWIAVHTDHQRHGIGRRLMEMSEQAVRERAGRRVYVDTSGREQYRSTRSFYERCGYVLEATLRDFYDEGDDRVIYVRKL